MGSQALLKGHQAGQMESIQPVGPAELSFVLVSYQVHISLQRWWSLFSRAEQFGILKVNGKEDALKLYFNTDLLP